MIDFITDDFEPSSAAAWKQKIQFELNGADYNKTLLTNTNEGITIKPFYHADTFEKILVPKIKGNFKTCQKIIFTNETETNLKALKTIKNGINALKFIIDKPFDVEILFKNLLNNKIDLHFEFSFISEDFFHKLLSYLKAETVFLNIDIIGNFAKTGNWYQNFQSDFNIIENLLQKNNSTFLLSVNAGLYQNTGANTVQQVAYALAHVNEYLTRFGGNIADKIQFNFAIGSNFFFETAKIRAFKYLLNLILTKYNTQTDAKIFTEPSLRNKTILDNNTNNLRSVSENISAVLGGANTICWTTNNEFRKDFDQYFNDTTIVNDSYYMEAITKQIAEKALSIFKDIEKSGGFLSQLKEGTIQRKIKENALKEQTQFDNNELVLIGGNHQVNELDKTKPYLDSNQFPKKKGHKTLIVPIIPVRLAEKVEQKRLKNEA